MVVFLQPFIDDGTTPHAVHFRAEKGDLVLEETRLRLVAAGLGHEDWNGKFTLAAISIVRASGRF